MQGIHETFHSSCVSWSLCEGIGQRQILGPGAEYHWGQNYYFFSRINIPDYVLGVYITELVLNSFSGYVTSCVVAKHTMRISDYIT